MARVTKYQVHRFMEDFCYETVDPRNLTPIGFELSYKCDTAFCGQIITEQIDWPDSFKFEIDRQCQCGAEFRMSQVHLIDIDMPSTNLAVYYVFGDFSIQKALHYDGDLQWELIFPSKYVEIFHTYTDGEWRFQEHPPEARPFVSGLRLEIELAGGADVVGEGRH